MRARWTTLQMASSTQSGTTLCCTATFTNTLTLFFPIISSMDLFMGSVFGFVSSGPEHPATSWLTR